MAYTKSWKRTMRKIDGKPRIVKIRRTNGRIQIRVVHHRNLTDKTARARGRFRMKNRVSSTDRGSRGHNRKSRGRFLDLTKK